MCVMCHCCFCTMSYCKNTFSHIITRFLLPKTLGLWALVLEERVESGAADEEMVVLKGLRKVYLGYEIVYQRGIFAQGFFC